MASGDRLLLLSENGPEWTVAALAAMNLGAVVVPVASIASFLELKNTILDARPRLSFVSRRVPASTQVQDFLRSEGLSCLVWDLQTDDPLAEWTKEAPLEIDESMGAHAQALRIYTSGTTGHPKAVPISHENVLSNAEAVLRVIEAEPGDRLVSVLPLSHLFEFTGGFVTPTLMGCSITYVKSLKAEDLLQALRDTKASIMVGVPLLFEVISRNLQARMDELPFPLPPVFRFFTKLTRNNRALGPYLFYPIHKALGGHIRYFMAGGSKLHPQVFEFFRGIGITVLQGYGLTETSPVLTVTSPGNASADHVGAAVPGVQVGIFDEYGNRLATGQEGEIWAKGPNVFQGYLDPEHSKDVFFDGWFRTGDLGCLDSEGLLRITGRKKDLIVTPAGKNVYPEEIEGVVLSTGLFLEACALGLHDTAGHEKVGLVLVPDRPKFPGQSLEQIRQAATQRAMEACRTLTEYKWPQRIEVLFEELPKTATRKIKKHEVRRLLAGRDEKARDAAGDGSTLDLSSELEAAIAHGIASISRVSESSIRPSDSLTKDLGLDSLTFVELVSHVEKKFGTRIEGIDFASILTVQDLVTALEFTAGPPRRVTRIRLAEFSPRENGSFLWRLPRSLFNLALRAYLRARHGLKVEGVENLAGGGPFVFTPNHSSHFDLLSIAGSVPEGLVHRTFAVAAKDYFFNRGWKALFSRLLVNAIPFDRRGRVDESMKHCREAIDQGGSLVVFPEGTRSPSGELQAFKPGVAQLLAGHEKARAVPVYIDGAHGIMPKGSRFPGPGRLRIRYGKPISFRETEVSSEGFKQVAERLRREVEALRGV